MTPKELYEVVKDKDIYEMYVWANWFFRRGRVSCVECVRTRAMLSKEKPNCVKCGLPSARLIKRTFNNHIEDDILDWENNQEDTNNEEI